MNRSAKINIFPRESGSKVVSALMTSMQSIRQVLLPGAAISQKFLVLHRDLYWIPTKLNYQPVSFVLSADKFE